MKKITLATFLILFLISSSAFGQIDNYGLKLGGLQVLILNRLNLVELQDLGFTALPT